MHVKYGKQHNNAVRNAVRGIVIKDGLIGMVKVEKYDCFIFPGGGVDEGESLEVALKREMLEEAGLIVDISKHLLTTETAEYRFTHVNHFYLCEIIGTGESCLTDIEIDLDMHFEWIPINELYDYFLNYHDDLRFGEENKVVQRSIKSRGFMIMSLLNNMFDWRIETRWLGRSVDMKFDRPVGFQSKPEYTPYPINYGFIENIYSLDGGEVDCYYLDSDEPLNEASGKVVAVVKRFDDVENKLVVSNQNHSKEEIHDAINFIEQYFDSIILMWGVDMIVKEEKNGFKLYKDESAIGRLDLEITPEYIDALFIGVNPDFRGTEAKDLLLNALIDLSNEKNLLIHATCGYMRKWFSRNRPELLENDFQ